MTLKPITSQEEFNAVLEAGKSDGHFLTAPTHVVRNGDTIIGAVTILPTALVWMDTQKAKVRESVQLKDMLASHFAMTGNHVMCLPCSPDSPYTEYLPKDNFMNLGGFNLFVKVI